MIHGNEPDETTLRGVAWARRRAIEHLRTIGADLRRDDNERHGAALVVDELRRAEALARGVSGPVPAPPRGVHALANVVSNLLQTGRYSDEEGEATARLLDLLKSLTDGALVPATPTQAMLDAADKVLDSDPRHIAEAWRAMVAAAGVKACPACGGNDRDAPCAFPEGGQPGCVRDKRIAGVTPPLTVEDWMRQQGLDPSLEDTDRTHWIREAFAAGRAAGVVGCKHPREQTSTGPTTDQINHYCPDCNTAWTTYPAHGVTVPAECLRCRMRHPETGACCGVYRAAGVTACLSRDGKPNHCVLWKCHEAKACAHGVAPAVEAQPFGWVVKDGFYRDKAAADSRAYVLASAAGEVHPVIPVQRAAGVMVPDRKTF
jgi:hypothetical protein